MKNAFSGLILMLVSFALAPSLSSAMTEAEAKACGLRDIKRIDAAKDGLTLLKVYKSSIGRFLAAYDPRDTTLTRTGKEKALLVIAASDSCDYLDEVAQGAGKAYWKEFGVSEPKKRAEYYDWLAVMNALTFVSEYNDRVSELLTANGYTTAAKTLQYKHTLVRRIAIEGSADGNDLSFTLKYFGVQPDQASAITADELESLLLASLKKSERAKFLKWITN